MTYLLTLGSWGMKGEHVGSGECLLPWGSARFGGVKVFWYGHLCLGYFPVMPRRGWVLGDPDQAWANPALARV